MDRRLLLAALVALAALAATVLVIAGRESPRRGGETFRGVRCTSFASTSGNDEGAGTAASPYRTVRKLLATLRPGETGCLDGGTFAEDVKIERGGTDGAPLTISSAPGERATVRGKFEVAGSAHDVVVANLNLDGRNDVEARVSPIVNGDRIRFTGNEVTNEHTAICFGIGHHDYGIAEDVVIDHNRIHDCGRLPRTNLDHGIYVVAARRTIIRANYIYGNADRGIQLYPDAQGSLIELNVIDGNGVGIIFSGNDRYASSNNHVRRNVIANSKARHNVESSYPGPLGHGNVVERNCLWQGRSGNVGEREGFTAEDNVVADPMYVDAEGEDFRLRDESRCAPILREV